MSLTRTSGLFPVAQLPAAQVVRARVILANLENQSAVATVNVAKLIGEAIKQTVLQEDVEIPGDGRRTLELPSDVVEGQTLEVTVRLPSDGFVPPQSGVVPGVAVITTFTADQSTSLLQWISAGDFAADGSLAG